jgi:hypothetical protein
VTIVLVPGFLVVRDNKLCGGINVSFDGIFVRPLPRPRLDKPHSIAR